MKICNLQSIIERIYWINISSSFLWNRYLFMTYTYRRKSQWKWNGQKKILFWFMVLTTTGQWNPWIMNRAPTSSYNTLIWTAAIIFMPPAWKVRLEHLVIGSSVRLFVHPSVRPSVWPWFRPVYKQSEIFKVWVMIQ